MEQEPQQTARFPNVANPPAEPVGNDSEDPQNDSEDVRNEEVEPSEKRAGFPKFKKRTADHNTTVRTAAKSLEASGHPITERTIINWCYPAKHGSAKLDCAWDENLGKYFITQASLEKAIADMPTAQPSEQPPILQKDPQSDSESDAELPKRKEQSSEEVQKGSESEDTVSVEEADQPPPSGNNSNAELRELRRLTFEQEHTIRGKDIVIDQLQAAWDKLADRLEKQSELVGGLRIENRQLKGLPAPQQSPAPPGQGSASPGSGDNEKPTSDRSEVDTSYDGAKPGNKSN